MAVRIARDVVSGALRVAEILLFVAYDDEASYGGPMSAEGEALERLGIEALERALGYAKLKRQLRFDATKRGGEQ